MKMRMFGAVAMMVVMVLSVSHPAVAEDKRQAISFSFQATSPTTLVGTYTLSGVLNESGAAEATVGQRQTGDGVIVLYSEKILHLAAGDIHLFVEGPATFTGETSIAQSGKWRLTGGTGAYSDIKGHGKAAIVGDVSTGEFTGAYQGKVNLK